MDEKESKREQFPGVGRGIDEDEPALGSEKPRILIMDADSRSLASLIRSTKHSDCEIRTHLGVEEILKDGFPVVPTCLLLGPKLSDGSDPINALKRLREEKWQLPVIYLAREWSLRMVVETMRAGANDFLTSPVDRVELSHSLCYALGKAIKSHGASMIASSARGRVASLNKREGEIVKLVIKGLLNKEIADELKLALITVKVYRANAMKKLGAGNPAEMVKIAVLGGLNIDGGKK